MWTHRILFHAWLLLLCADTSVYLESCIGIKQRCSSLLRTTKAFFIQQSSESAFASAESVSEEVLQENNFRKDERGRDGASSRVVELLEKEAEWDRERERLEIVGVILWPSVALSPPLSGSLSLSFPLTLAPPDQIQHEAEVRNCLQQLYILVSLPVPAFQLSGWPSINHVLLFGTMNVCMFCCFIDTEGVFFIFKHFSELDLIFFLCLDWKQTPLSKTCTQS